MTIQTLTRRQIGDLRSKAGYTLLEILIVMVIIGLLVTMVGVGLQRVLDGAKVNTAKTQIHALKASLDVMQLHIGRYPTAGEGLTILSQSPGDAAPGWQGPYLDKALPKDPWGHDYIYVAPAGDEEPKIKSLGKDGQEGGTGYAEDIVQ